MSNTLPTLQELNQDIEVAFKNDQLNLLLNQLPPAKWVKDHPFAKNVKYLPIERVEYLLTKIFQQWKVEVLAEGQLFNSVYVRVRLHYRNPTDGQWYSHDGLGAVGVQTDAGALASDMVKIKADAIMKALPAAESYAVKDAAEKLGKLFGKDLNRKEAIDFSMSYEEPATIEVVVRIEQLLQGCAYDAEMVRSIEKELEAGVSASRASELIEKLSNNQTNPITSGRPYGQADIKKQMNNHV